MTSWKVISSFGCEALGWRNWHEETRGGSAKCWDGRVILGSMYVFVLLQFILKNPCSGYDTLIGGILNVMMLIELGVFN